MQVAGVLPFGVVIAGSPDVTQLVECTPEMAAWCREEAHRQQAKAAALMAIAEAIERGLGTGPATP